MSSDHTTPEYGIVERLTPGIRRVLAHNPGPFTYQGTGTYLVGNGEVAVIDPGPSIPSHVDNILSALEPREVITHILITHTHADHSPAARLLKARTNAATFGFGPHGGSADETDSMEAGIDRDFTPDFELLDGECLRTENWEIEAVHTPGHCSNHLCFAYLDENTLFCGDHLMAWSTTVILPPDGNVRDYLQSLEKLAHRNESTYWPTHGPSIVEPHQYIDQIMSHRRQRIDQIRSSLKNAPATLSELRKALYPEIPTRLYTAAEYSILASIGYLTEEGDVICQSPNKRDSMFLAV
ncbi:MAG: MBL fold metallo-hydrolase [Gammaproteobacteria bacterium]|nr:MBL fold metallo-hydrolase [Gammaproteobacteria bacterium]